MRNQYVDMFLSSFCSLCPTAQRVTEGLHKWFLHLRHVSLRVKQSSPFSFDETHTVFNAGPTF